MSSDGRTCRWPRSRTCSRRVPPSTAARKRRGLVAESEPCPFRRILSLRLVYSYESGSWQSSRFFFCFLFFMANSWSWRSRSLRLHLDALLVPADHRHLPAVAMFLCQGECRPRPPSVDFDNDDDDDDDDEPNTKKKTKLVLSLRQTCRRREKRLLQIEFETGFGSHWNRLMDVLARLVSESRWLVAIFGRAKEGPSFSWDFRPRSSLILCLVLAFVCLCAPNHYHDRGVVLFESNKRISARSSGPSRGGRGGSQCAVRWLAERRRHWITRALSVKRVCSKHNDIWNWVVVFSQHLRTGRLLIQSFHGNETRLDPFPFRLSFDGSVATRWRWSRHSRWWKKTTFSPPLPQWCTSTLKRHISWCT